MKIEPKDVLILLNLGKVSFAQKKYDEAKLYFENVIQIDPLNAQGYYMLS